MSKSVPLPIDWAALAVMSGPSLMTAAGEALRQHFDDLDEATEDAALRELPQAFRDLHVLGWLHFETILGGFGSYFEKNQGRCAALAVEALRRLGDQELAALLEKAILIVAKHDGTTARRRAEIARAPQFTKLEYFENAEDAFDEFEEFEDRAAELIDGHSRWPALLEAQLDLWAKDYRARLN